jgi:hypothetical protein
LQRQVIRLLDDVEAQRKVTTVQAEVTGSVKTLRLSGVLGGWGGATAARQGQQRFD